ncbi:MAG: HIT domain-containing protein [Thermomonas sp.]
MSRWALHPQLAQDTVPVIELPLCEVRLMDDANHPWLVLVPRVADAVELIDLDAAQRHALTDEIDAASRALKALFQPDKLNVAALGNMVPQLHIHVIARYREDIAWPRPVWGVANARPYAPEQLVERVSALGAALTSSAT